MTDVETITVADVSDGPGGTDDAEPGTTVRLPAVEILTGRGFITGKSGSGKSNTASVVIEKLLDSQFPVLIVDTDGEYYGLKEEYEILHAGADEECDIVVSPEHAERIATLALEQNVPIILDVSGYLDENDADEMVLQTARQLFAKEKKLKKPFLMLVEECHEYIPEKGGMGEAGKMLIKIGKRGRKHGLGIVGISQRPADVKKDYITQCDWLVWHRLTWGNDTKVVGRILGKEYADAIESMNDGEAFMMTDWSETLRRVQFRRKQTFDAGATPGLDDFERPELKSVSGDLVSELRDISDEQARRESTVADLRQELDKKDAEIRRLKSELAEAQDLSRMADQFAQALLQKAEAPYRGGEGRNLARPENGQSALGEYESNAEDGPQLVGPVDSGVDTGSDADSEPERVNGSAAASLSPESAGESGSEANEAGETTAETEARAESTEPSPAGRSDRDGRSTAVEGSRRAIVDELRDVVESLDDVTREMLAHYRATDLSTPVDAHVGAGHSGDQQLAYGRNRALRQAGFIEHVGRGRYRYTLPELVRDEYADRLADGEFAATVTAVESSFANVSLGRTGVASDADRVSDTVGTVDTADGDTTVDADSDDGTETAAAGENDDRENGENETDRTDRRENRSTEEETDTDGTTLADVGQVVEDAELVDDGAEAGRATGSPTETESTPSDDSESFEDGDAKADETGATPSDDAEIID
ncbi:helicase HerA domain-containing protein [Haloprofundus halobius]|uniref:helicase HerA domain-containing protein n=1 Tax=Haloprofundus halobius TaxID=2876194 RepID=UPI001CCE94E2|nr:DUF87 domain-containing protein [Haloprofundus halobius]